MTMSLEDNHSWQMLLVVTVALPATVAVVVVVAAADVVAAAIAAADSCNAFTYFRNCLYLSLTQMHER